VSQHLTLTVPDELYTHLHKISDERDLAAVDVAAAWLHEALSHYRLSQHLAPFADLGEILSPQQHQELLHLLQDDPETGDDAAQIRLSELLRQYRQGLIRQAQAITKWLAAETTTAYEVAVTDLTTVESSMLYAIGYNVERQVLEVVFNSGGIYRYLDVPPDIYKGLLEASSKGRFMWDHIFNLFPYEQLRVRRKRMALNQETPTD
jgi:hypothetical protein